MFRTAGDETAFDLLIHLAAPRFDGVRVHELLEDLDAKGIRVQRHMRTPEQHLSWIDAEFGSWWSSIASLGGSYIACDAEGPVGFATFDPQGMRFPFPLAGASEDGTGIMGPFGVALRARKSGLGPALLHGALFSLRERGYTQALVPAIGNSRLIAYFRHHTDRLIERPHASHTRQRYKTLVLASGNGTNFQAVIDAVHSKRIPLDIVRLIVNHADAHAIERAQIAGIPVTTLLWDRAEMTRAAFDAEILAASAAAEPDLVLLLGWMHVLPDTFIERFPHILNVHPAFLPLDPALDTVSMPNGDVIPAIRGIHAVGKALERNAKWFGATVHRVTPAIDRGEVLIRAPLLRESGEPREQLFERIHALEHRILIDGIERWMLERD